MFDDTRVDAELLSARVTVTQPREIASYDRAFAALSAMAVRGHEARALRVAVRSAAWSGTPQMAHQVRMSAGEGVLWACSIREHLDSCHPAARATCLAVNSASLRISRSRAASASSAC